MVFEGDTLFDSSFVSVVIASSAITCLVLTIKNGAVRIARLPAYLKSAYRVCVSHSGWLIRVEFRSELSIWVV